jgi:cytochrome c553
MVDVSMLPLAVLILILSVGFGVVLHDGVNLRWRRVGRSRHGEVFKVKYQRLIVTACVVSGGAMALATLCLSQVPRRDSAIMSSRTIQAPHGKVVILHVRAPASMQSAGRRKLDRWYFGRRVASEAGCAACHRIGESGNSGPGMQLTQIGARLSKRELYKSLSDAHPPMPSFRSMPRNKLRPLIFFLEMLRGGHRTRR